MAAPERPRRPSDALAVAFGGAFVLGAAACAAVVAAGNRAAMARRARSLPDETAFGAFLAAREAVADAALRQAMEERSVTGDPLGVVLVRRGALTVPSLRAALREFAASPPA